MKQVHDSLAQAGHLHGQETSMWADSELGLRTNVTPQSATVAVVIGGVHVCKGRRGATVSS